MRIVVTGGSGHLGGMVVEYAAARGHDVWVADLEPPAKPDLAAHRFHQGDVNSEELTSFVASKLGTVPGVVIHLAGIIGTEELFDRAFDAVDVNIKGTLRVLEGCRRAGAGYVGVETGTPWRTPYSITKRAAKELAEGWHIRYRFPSTTLRVFNLYGPGPSHASKVIPRFMEAAAARKPLPIIGSGLQSLDLVWAQSVAEAFVTAAERAPGRGETIDIGSGVSRTVLEFGGLVNELAGSSAGFQHIGDRPGEGPEHPVADTDPAFQMLDWVSADEDEETFRERMRQTLAWYQGA